MVRIPEKRVCDICGDTAGELSTEFTSKPKHLVTINDLDDLQIVLEHKDKSKSQIVSSDCICGEVLQCPICKLDRCPSCTDWCCEDQGRSYRTFDGVYLKTSQD